MSYESGGNAAPTRHYIQPEKMATNRGVHNLPHGPVDMHRSHPAGQSSVTVNPPGSRAQVDKKSMNYVVRSGIAGGFAACAAKTIVGPLDRVKILYQTSNPQFAKYTGSWLGVFRAMRDINAQEGLRGLFRGHSATLLRIFPYGGIKFLAYEQIRNVVIPSRAEETHFRRLISGSMAGVTSVLCTYPLEVIRVRLAFETKKESRSSLRRICKQIYSEHPTISPATGEPTAIANMTPRSGIANFYRGFVPTLVGMVPYAGMSFLTHDAIGDWLRHPSISRYTAIKSTLPSESGSLSKKARRVQLNAPAELTAGAIAGVVSQTASYPMEVIRRRMQVGGAVGDRHRLRMGEVARSVWRERGFKGFFVGLTVGYLKVVPMAATSFFVYERGKWWLGIET